MQNNNFSDGYKKILINSENAAKNVGLKNLKVEDIFLEIVDSSEYAIKDLFNLYGINSKLTFEIIKKGLFNEKPERRKGIYAGISEELKDVILGSVKIAASYSKEKASIEDLLLSMLRSNPWLQQFFNYIGINSKDFEKNLEKLNEENFYDGIPPSINGNNPQNMSNISMEEGISKLLGAITENLFMGMGMDEANGMQTPFDINQPQKGKINSDTPALDLFSTNLTQEAKEGKIDKVIGRDDEIERLIAILNRKTKNNPVLVGDPGVGKTAIVEGLAQRIAKGDIPFPMRDKKILALDLSMMIAGTKYRGEFESRIKQIIEEASKVENEVILFIDEIHTIIGAGSGEGTLDASNILKPAMGRGKIRVIGATTLNEYQKYIEKDSALERRFQKITVDEPDKETALKIITGLKDEFEEYHNLNITPEAIEESVNLSTRYITDRYLPDKAIDLIDEACSLKSMKYDVNEEEINKLKSKVIDLSKKIEQAVINNQYKKAVTLKEQQKKLEEKIQESKKKFTIPKSKRLKVTAGDIQKVISIATGIPTENLDVKDKENLKNLPKIMKSKIIGQDKAIETIVKSIMRSKIGIGNPNRPLGSFLFLGPTGVGKTELVKQLAENFYGDQNSLIKIDMSEYSDKTSSNKLIGSSAGYVGYEEGGYLTEKVRRKPYSIVLFDEIEKGEFEVYNLLLQILEEGVLTDNKGRKVNFKNTIIVMTSNIGQEEFKEKASQIGFDVSENKEKSIMEDFERASERITSNLSDYFPNEFINRIDKIVVFNPLDKNKIKQIVKLQLDELIARLSEKGIKISYQQNILNFITKIVYNPTFGAREVRRYITNNIEDKIAEILITSNSPKKEFSISVSKDDLIVA